MDALIFVGVGLSVVQLLLRRHAQAGTTGDTGQPDGLKDLLTALLADHRDRRVLTALRAAEGIAAELSSCAAPEVGIVSRSAWEAASYEVSTLLRDMSEDDLLVAVDGGDRLRDVLLEHGGRDRRTSLEEVAAQAAFDWLLETSCRTAVTYLITTAALAEVLNDIKHVKGALDGVLGRPVSVRSSAVVVKELEKRVRMLAPEELKDREQELAEIACLVREGSSPWLAYEAPRHSGGTALMATFACLPPQDMRVVSYFVRRNEAGHDRSGFVFAALAQLARVVGDPYASSPRTDEAPVALEKALRLAAAVCSHEGKTLVLLIDGLDEDAYHEAPDAPHAASILSALPRHLPPGVTVVTSSCPGPPAPRDMVCEAYAAARRQVLRPSPYALAHAAAARTLLADPSGLRVGAFLVASEGG